MSRRAIRASFFAFCLFLWNAIAFAQAPIPKLTSHVMDEAGLLSLSARAQIEADLRAYQEQTGHQFAVLTVGSLEGESIDGYGIRVAEEWELGDDKRDDGLILLISKQDRKMRVEVGYGLEGAVPDAVAAQVIRHKLRPAFQQGQFDSGVREAMQVLMKAASGEAVRLGPAEKKEKPSRGSSLFPILFWIFFLGMAIFKGRGSGGAGGLAAGLMLGSMSRRGGFGGGGGGGFGGFSGGGGGFGGGGASGDW